MSKTILCFETGGTKLVTALYTEAGLLLEREVLKRAPEQTARDTIEILCSSGRNLAQKYSNPAAVGWGFGGTVDRKTRTPAFCYHEPGWEDLDSLEMIEQSFPGIPVYVENDCNLGALAEAWVEPSNLPDMLFYATFGTGIGGGIVREGVLQQFSREGEGEIGHLVVEPGGCQCACGNKGCLETYCSGPGMSNLARKTVGAELNSYQIMEGFRRHDPDCIQIVHKGAEYIAMALSAVINILAPTEIVLGGGLMWQNQEFLEIIATKSKARAFPVLSQKARFRLSRLGEDLVCKGAYRYVLQNLQ